MKENKYSEKPILNKILYRNELFLVLIFCFLNLIYASLIAKSNNADISVKNIYEK